MFKAMVNGDWIPLVSVLIALGGWVFSVIRYRSGIRKEIRQREVKTNERILNVEIKTKENTKDIQELKEDQKDVKDELNKKIDIIDKRIYDLWVSRNK